MNKIGILYIGAIAGLAILSACDNRPSSHVVVHTPPPVVKPYVERQCSSFYNHRERGTVLQCRNLAGNGCYTLYEPDGDQKYYCRGRKVWEIEGNESWTSWGFMSRRHSQPRVVQEIIIVQPSPTARQLAASKNVKPKTRSQAMKAQAAVRKQQAAAKAKKQVANKPKQQSDAQAAQKAVQKQKQAAKKKPLVKISKPATKVKITKSKPVKTMKSKK